MKKKILVTILAASLAFGMLTGCGDAGATVRESAQTGENSEVGTDSEGGSGTESADSETESSESTENSESTESSEDTESSEESGEAEFVIPEVNIESYDIPDTEAFEFVHNMKIGWNLGNTFDAFRESPFADELESETQWVGIATTQEMIDDIREAGFNSIRIPVTWHPHVDENYQISEVWLNRVQEVVDYAYNNGMYVILNIHHDNSEGFMYPSTEYLEQSVSYVTSIWQQLAERFADYDEHLIFESMNEPRQVGTAWEWSVNGSADCKDAIACINEINQAFVNTVRATGGNNLNRYLMIPGYDASPDGATNAGFVLPTDADGVKDKLIISVHAYTPYNFALQADSESGSSSAFDSDTARFTADINTFMNKLYNKFIKEGIPVVIGEFGSRDKNQNTQSRIDHATYYIAAARARGMSCFWWDNNAFTGNGENFGLYYRRGGYFVYPEIVDALMKYAD